MPGTVSNNFQPSYSPGKDMQMSMGCAASLGKALAHLLFMTPGEEVATDRNYRPPRLMKRCTLFMRSCSTAHQHLADPKPCARAPALIPPRWRFAQSSWNINAWNTKHSNLFRIQALPSGNNPMEREVRADRGYHVRIYILRHGPQFRTSIRLMPASKDITKLDQDGEKCMP